MRRGRTTALAEHHRKVAGVEHLQTEHDLTVEKTNQDVREKKERSRRWA
jgi:hypothetical protein